MRKFLLRFTISASMIFSLLVSPGFSENYESGFEPLSPEFLRWQEEQESKSSLPSAKNSSSSYEYPSGYVPIPVDLSHLAENPPVEDSSPVPNRMASTLPAKYDLRNVNGKSYITGVKSQSPYGSCWSFASIGAMESNMLMKNAGTYDLSEMHLAWFTFKNADKSKVFKNLSSANFKTVLDNGGNSFYPAALFSRLDGPAYESDVPYGENKQPSQSKPDTYTRALRLRDVYYLSLGAEPNVNASEEARNIVKRRIMETGAVVGNYCSNNTSYYKSASAGTNYYYNSSATNHAVQIIGWDDNYSRSNFKTNPGVDGAWLIKNSWGNTWWNGSANVGDEGCFWMSYAQHLTEGSAFIAEKVNTSMKVYDYSPLGWCSTWGYTSGTSQIYFANVFKAEEDGEQLIEVGFYTPDNNIKYEISVYTGMNSMPSARPMPSGNTAATPSASGTISYAGYHTITLDNPVTLTGGEYFSVVVRFTNSTKIAVEKAVSGWSNGATVEEGSFFSPNGTTWLLGKAQSMNACVKAFTVKGTSSGIAPNIRDGYPPDAFLNQAYSYTPSASGTKPITWSAGSTIPTGLAINSSTGEISGTPTAEGSFTFSVTAKNSYGFDTKNYTVNVLDIPLINAEEITGYVGYSMSRQMTLSPSVSAAWSTSTKLPAGLSLSKAGLLSGKPTKAGTTLVKLKAVSSSGTSEATITITINAKPVRPAIKIASLKTITIGENFSHAITATGTEPITITIEGQPSGITLNGATAYMSGTPTAAGTFSIKITAANIATQMDNRPVTKTVKLTVKARPPVIASPGALSDAIMGEEYGGVQFSTSDGTDPITWTVSGQPSGMKITSSGFLYGTPTRAGNFTLAVRASNSGGKTTMKVPLKVLQKPTIATKKLSNATTDKKYSAKITAKGTTPITWTVSGLPDTLSLTQNAAGTTAAITGTPVAVGTYTVKLKAENAAGITESTLNLTVAGVAPKLTASLAKGSAGKSYSETRISATGTKPIDISYTISDSDKAKFGINSLDDLGLTFTAYPNEGRAVITGTPKISLKNLPITFSAKNSVSSRAVTKKVSFTIAGQKPVFTSPGSATTNIFCEVNTNISLDFTVSGTKNITYSMNKAAGFSLEQTGDYKAVLTGKAPAKDSTTTITVTAANSDGKSTRKIVIKTHTPPKINTSSLPSGTLKKSYSASLAVTGTKTIKWAVSGSLPDGMKFSSGKFSGTPKEAGNFTLKVTASNSIGKDEKEFTLSIADPNAQTASPPEIVPETLGESLPEKSSQPETIIEPEISFGSDRTIEPHREEIESEGYIIAAVLPEISVNVSGMYDINVELSENAPEGAVLYWLAYPDNEGSEDDAIAEFYDESGAEIETVPAGRKIVVSAWLNEGVKYSPVIAVK